MQTPGIMLTIVLLLAIPVIAVLVAVAWQKRK
jgi:hypothetical protein